jgi:hypothetical protein
MCAGGGQKHSRSWFATATRRLQFVRAVIDFCDLGALSCQILAHPLVYRLQFSRRQQSFRHASLVANCQNAESRLREQSDRFRNSWKNLHLFPSRYVLAFRRPSVDNPITIQKRSPHHRKLQTPGEEEARTLVEKDPQIDREPVQFFIPEARQPFARSASRAVIFQEFFHEIGRKSSFRVRRDLSALWFAINSDSFKSRLSKCRAICTI